MIQDDYRKMKTGMIQALGISQCAVCGETALYVANSSLGAFSLAYCDRCAKLGAEPWGFLIDVLIDSGILGPDDASGFMKDVIQSTCRAYGRQPSDVWAEIYNKMCCG